MELLVVAPMRFEFTLNRSQTAFKNQDFFKFWENIKKLNYKDSNFNKIDYYKTKMNSFEKESYDDTSKVDLIILGISLEDISQKVIDNFKNNDDFVKKYFDKIKKSQIKVYDNTISIFDFRIILKDINKNELEFTKNCENKIKQILKEILTQITNSLNKFIIFLMKNDKLNIIQKKNQDSEYDDFLDFYRENKNLSVIWASCAIKYDEPNTKLTNTWLKDVVESEKIKIINLDSKAYSLDWLKYVFREDVDNYEELWDVMFLAQYFYAVIEVIIYNLRFIINESYRVEQNKPSIFNFFKKNKIVLVNQKLEAIAETSYLHIIEYKDIKKYLKRNSFTLFNEILEAWTFNELIENTQELLSSVKDRVNLIFNKLSTKNNFYTDILLTFIGFFAIIELVINFSQYSREYTADAMISSRQSDEDSILNYLATIPIDTFIGSGFFISFVLLIGYFIYRKRILP